MSKYKVGDIINASYNYGEELYYLIIEVSHSKRKYNTIHVASGREKPIGFDTAHSCYGIISRA